MNRLLINMQNKVKILKGAINQCDKLIKDEQITLNGLNSIVVSKGNITDEDLRKRQYQLTDEMIGLENRIERMGGRV